VLATACGTHFLHDGFADVLYVFLPVWAREFRLSFAQVGAIRTAYTGGMALFQMPAGLLAERWGERWLLAVGTAVTAAGFVTVGTAGGFAALLVILAPTGFGSGVQHPLSSSLVSKAYETGPRRAALGTYNFAGDLGKVTVPALVGLGATVVGWRLASAGYGAVGLAAAVTLLLLLMRLGAGAEPSVAERRPLPGGGWGIRDARGFGALAGIGILDNGTRTAFLTFLPFVLIAKGLNVAGVGGALALIFAGGATGKFACGLVAERVGVIRTVVLTEAATSLGILTVVASPLPAALGVLFPLGIALNGTSSVLYATVADLVTPERRTRTYGLYYTLSLGASALAPSVYGVVSDAAGVATTLAVVGTAILATIPLCLVLRPAVATGA
jgi:MFS transporter, FSR family, fosmidomycin resistance protein